MRAAIIALAVLVAVSAGMPDYATMFANFKAKYGRSYASQGEEAKRFGVFVSNMKVAEKLMKVNPHAAFGANEFADMTAQEFKSRHNAEAFYARKMAKRSLSTPVSFTAEQMKATGSAIDWRTKGAVTGVKNQGQCGSCWAFSSTGSIEGQWFLAGNQLTSVSEQELVSCDTIDEGCNGGLMDNAWTWLMQAHSGQIVTEASYPYVSGDGIAPACDMSNTVVGATITGHSDITKTESAMATWVYSNGPLSVAVDATSWQTYMGGILTNCISSQIDHGVLIVGFDENNSPPYWIIKNSWGASWGENGYIRVEKGTDQCLITDDPCSSKVASGPGPTPTGPTPPTPPTPGGWFEQKTCKNDKCTDCTTDRLPQNSCIKGTKSSFKAQCITDGLLVQSYNTADCSGDYFTTVNPVDQCSIVFEKDKAFEWVLNSCGGKPPGPPSPTPAPGPGSFVQEQCTDAACSVGCQNYTFALGQCLQLSDGGSAIATCNSQGLLLTEYPFSSSCSGQSIPDQMPTDQCLQDEDGTYFENFCVAGSKRTVGAAQHKVKKISKKH